MHGVSQFNQEAWFKPYIKMNTKFRTESKNDFEKHFFKLMNDSVFGKTIENLRKHRDVRLVTTDRRWNQLVPEPNYHTAKCFWEDLLAMEMKKIKVKLNKLVYLGLSILEISKTLTYGFWYDYINIKTMQNYVIWILVALLFTLKLFIKILQMMLKKIWYIKLWSS